MREVRISPDGNSVAIRTDHPEGAWNEWGVMSAVNGGAWSDGVYVEGWTPITEGDSQ